MCDYPSLSGVCSLGRFAVLPVIPEGDVQSLRQLLLELIRILHLQEGVHADRHLHYEDGQQYDGILKTDRRWSVKWAFLQLPS